MSSEPKWDDYECRQLFLGDWQTWAREELARKDVRIRSLEQERDEATVSYWTKMYVDMVDHAREERTERDAARAELARLREALRRVNAEGYWTEIHPGGQDWCIPDNLKLEIERITRALAPSAAQGESSMEEKE